MHYSQNYFLTFKQVKELGGTIKKGEKSEIVIFWKWIEKENEQSKKTEKVPLLRYYHVFNISQTEGIPKDRLPPVIERKNDPIQTCEEIIANMPDRPEIRHEQHRAFYNKAEDFVNMPRRESFVSSESYYSVLFHELLHSTGAEKRLNRRELVDSKGFGTREYAIEEITVEMGASYLKSYAGIPIEQLENNAAYIQSWLKRLKQDKKFIIHASARAQQAADFILNIKNVEKEFELSQEHLEVFDKSTEKVGEMREVRNRELINIRDRGNEESERNIDLRS